MDTLSRVQAKTASNDITRHVRHAAACVVRSVDQHLGRPVAVRAGLHRDHPDRLVDLRCPRKVLRVVTNPSVTAWCSLEGDRRC
jgi:hypothetical protein